MLNLSRHTGDDPLNFGRVNSWRDSFGRQNGDAAPVYFPAGSVDVRSPGVSRIRSIYVQANAANTTVEIKVNGVDVVFQNPVKTFSVPAGTGKEFKVNGQFLNVGDRLQVIVSASDAVVSMAVLRA